MAFWFVGTGGFWGEVGEVIVLLELWLIPEKQSIVSSIFCTIFYQTQKLEDQKKITPTKYRNSQNKHTDKCL